MSGIEIGLLSIPLLLILLALHIHVGIALAVIGLLGFYLLTGDINIALALLSTTPYKTVANYALTVVPMFILMGTLAGHAGFAEEAYRSARKWVSKIPGGLAMATTIGNAAFGAACGASVAACAVFTRFSLPEMKRHGYQTDFACAAIVAAGALAMLIPPSVLMIIYGILTEQSISHLFIAGVFPGLLLTALYCIGILVMVKVNPKLVGGKVAEVDTSTWKERFTSLSGLWGIGVIMIIVLGGIYSGILSPTEAGAASAFAAFVISLAMRKLNWGIMRDIFLDAGRTTVMIFLILIGATIYSKFVTVSGLTTGFVEWVVGTNLPPLAVLCAFIFMYLLLGCLLDSISMMTITLPLVIPVAVAFGWHPIWFAMIVIMSIEAGLFTPPMGLNIYTVKAVAGSEVRVEDLFRAIVPFLIIVLISLVFLIAFPQICTWLPELM